VKRQINKQPPINIEEPLVRVEFNDPEQQRAADTYHLIGRAVWDAWEGRHDVVTGLLNRRGFEDAVKAHITKARDVPYALIAVDLGNFKAINDKFGHAYGDKVLRQFADSLRGSDAKTIIQSSSDKEGVSARHGGDEFVVFAPLTGREGRQGMDVQDRFKGLLQTITDAGHDIRNKDENLQRHGAQFFAAVGGTIYNPDITFEDNLLLADIDLEEAKPPLHEAFGQYRTLDDDDLK
jgi:diguanylate cyclase (GGDEF)-like protein